MTEDESWWSLGYAEPEVETDTIREDEKGKGAPLRERAEAFAVDLSFFCDEIVRVERGVSTRVMARQLFRAGSAIGALLEEADAAQSRADFISKCSIALKEARESRYWLRVLQKRHHGRDLSRYLDEAKQFIAILTTIVRRSRRE